MALTKDFEFTPVGFDSPAILKNAYCRVDGIAGGKNGITVSLVCYKRDGDKLSVASTFSHSFVPVVGVGARDFIAQAYEYIKTLPMFADAMDC